MSGDSRCCDVKHLSLLSQNWERERGESEVGERLRGDKRLKNLLQDPRQGKKEEVPRQVRGSRDANQKTGV